MARRDVLPRRRARRDDCDHIVYPCPSNTALCLLGHHYRGDPDRSLLWPHRQFHQWRAVWTAEQCPLGHDLPKWRPGAAPSEPALRSLLRRHSPLHPAPRRRAAPCETAPGGRHWVVSGRLCGGPDVWRTIPATGPAIGVPDFRHDDGPAVVDPVADRRHPDHRLGAARARSGPVMSAEIAAKIVRRIRAEGPLTVAAYMAMALHDPEGGYYARRGPIGAAGDFTTAPEISQVFGELIGLWCAELWDRIGRPDPVVLAELGPGRGVLMSDLLRAGGTVPEFRRALRICLVEASPVLRAEQERRLRQVQPAWMSRVEELPEGPMLMVAN